MLPLFVFPFSWNWNGRKTRIFMTLWLIDTCQSKVSADQCHMTISRAQVYSSLLDRGLKLGLHVVFRAGLLGSRKTLTQDWNLTEVRIMFCVVWDYSNSKQKTKTINRKPHHNVTKLNSKFACVLSPSKVKFLRYN